MSLEVKQAVKLAKEYIADLYNGEPISGIGLEEVRHYDEKKEWHITIGFFRQYEDTPAMTFLSQRDRLFKRVVIDDSNVVRNGGRVTEVNNYQTVF